MDRGLASHGTMCPIMLWASRLRACSGKEGVEWWRCRGVLVRLPKYIQSKLNRLKRCTVSSLQRSASARMHSEPRARDRPDGSSIQTSTEAKIHASCVSANAQLYSVALGLLEYLPQIAAALSDVYQLNIITVVAQTK